MADLRSLLALALPIVLVQVGVMAMGVVDTIMVGHVSAADLAATALGNLYFFSCSVFGMGALMALDPIASQAVGAGDRVAVARALQRALVLTFVLAFITTPFLLFAEPVLRALGQPPEVVPLAGRYVQYSIPGVLAFFTFVVLRQSLQAMRRMRPVVTTIVIANLLNAGLCWLLVYGHVPPYRGAVGAALATTIARWSMVALILAAAWRDLRPLLWPVLPEAFRVAPLVRMLRLGLPIGVQYGLEVGVFSVVALLMGRLGTVPMAAHQVAINIASFTFMVPLGVSSAASVLVGHAVGAGDPTGARRAAVAALAAGFAFMLASGIVLCAAPGLLARVYSSDPGVVALAAALIPIAGVFQVFDGLQVVSIGVLRGVGDTRTPMIVNILGFWLIGLPISLWLGFQVGAGARGLWWGFVAGLAAVAAFLVWRVRVRLAGSLERLVIDEPAPVA